jgi:hypothetical protein
MKFLINLSFSLYWQVAVNNYAGSYEDGENKKSNLLHINGGLSI